MSEQAPKPADAAPDPDPGPDPAPQPKAKKKRRWPRRVRITVLVLLVLAFSLRIALNFLLPSVLRKVAAGYGLDCTYERSELTLLGGDFGLWHLDFTPKGGGESVLHLGYCRGNVSVLQLLRGRLDIWRLEADGVDVSIERLADGRIPLIERFAQPAAAPAPSPKSDTPAPAPAPAPAGKGTQEAFQLAPPLKIDALRVERLRIRLRDRAVNPPLETTVLANLRLSDLGSTVRPARMELNVEASDVLDGLTVFVEGAGDGKQAHANVEVTVRGFRPKGLAGYLEPLGIHAVAEGINAHAAGTARAVVATQPAGSPPALAGRLEFHDVALTADGQTAAAIKSLALDVNSASAGSASLGALAIDGVKLAGQRTRAGNVRVAGLEFVARASVPTAGPVGSSAHAPPPARATEVASDAPTATPTIGPSPFQFLFSAVTVHDVRLEFNDEAQSPPVQVAVVLDDLSTKDPILNADGSLKTLIFTGALRIPGVASSMKLDGSIEPFTARKSIDLAIAAEGIAPELLRPYLAAAGVESTLRSATLSCSLKSTFELDSAGRLLAQAGLKGIKLADGATLFELGDASVEGFVSDPATGRIRLETVTIDGPSLPIRREADGRFCLLGFRPTVASSPAAVPPSPPVADKTTGTGAATPPPPVPQAPSTSAGLPRLEIGKLTWSNLRLDLSDETTRPATTTFLTDIALEVTDLALGADPSRPITQPGRIKMRLRAPSLARELSLQGTIIPNPNSLALDLTLTGEGLSTAAIQSYLQPMGIQPTFTDGSLAASAKVNLKQDAGATLADLSLANVRLANGTTELAGVDTVAIRGLVRKAGDLTVGEIEIVKPRTTAVREKDGTLIIAGVKLLKPSTSPAVASARPPAPDVSRPPAPATPPPATAPAPEPVPASVTALSKVRITDAAVNWTDCAVSPSVAASLHASVELDQFILGSSDAKPSPIKVTASADSGLKQFALTGTVLAAPSKQSAHLDIAADGIAPAAIYAYLPPGVEVATRDGRLKTSIDASISENPKGGQAVSVRIDGIDWRDGTDAVPLFKLDSLVLTAPRIDPAHDLIAVNEISVFGVETDVRLEPGNITRLLGLKLSPPPPPVAPPHADALAAAESPRIAPATEPAPAPDVASLVAAGRKTPVAVTVEKLDLNIRRASLLDANHPGSAPITVSGLRFRNLQRIEWAGGDATTRPTRFELTGRIDPVVSQLTLAAAIAPFAQQPTAQLDLVLSGIKGDGLTALRPELRQAIDGSKLTDGRFTARAETTLTLERRGAGNLDVSTLGEELQKGFAADVVLKNLEYRANPDGPVLAGLEELRVENAKVRPKTGSVIVKSLEITKPQGILTRDGQGIHALGWTLRAAASQPNTTQPVALADARKPAAPAGPTPPAAAAKAAPAASPATKPTGEIRVDQFIMSGLDLRLEDATSTPPLVLPLTGLDVEAKGLSNMALYEDRPIRFTALVSSGKVSLPRRPKGTGIPGLLADIAAGPKAATTMPREEREFFSQITASGKVTLSPKLRGWAKVSINGFEVAGLAGPAKELGGVTLGGGVFDASVDLRFNDDDKIEVRSKHVFTDLLVSEPKNGPIAKNLKLAGGLDLAIRALQDVDGSITLPVKVQVADGRIEGLGSAAVGAVAGVIGTAIASAPIKAVAGVGDLLGLGGAKKPGAEAPRILQFRPAYTELEAEQVAGINEVIEKMRRDRNMEVTLRHEIGGGDIPRAEARANPSVAEATDLAYRLRNRKIELTRVRSEVAGAAQAQLMYPANDQTAAAIERLRAIDRELARTEDALDTVYELMRPGAERQGARRTRQAAIEFGRDRLSAVQAQLLASDLPDVEKRVRVISPGFDPSEDQNAGGKVTLMLISKKRQ